MYTSYELIYSGTSFHPSPDCPMYYTVGEVPSGRKHPPSKGSVSGAFTQMHRCWL